MSAIIRPRDEWDMKEDARTLARAEEIRADKARYNDAVKMAKVLVQEKKDQMDSMRAVAGKKSLRTNGGLDVTFNETLKGIGAKNGR